jgi:hypothetical protein
MGIFLEILRRLREAAEEPVFRALRRLRASLRSSLAQTIAAQAILAIERHRHARGFLSTPA